MIAEETAMSMERPYGGQPYFKLQSKNFFDLAHGQSPGWQADPPFRGGGCLPLCCPTPFSLWKSFRRSRTLFRDRPETVRLHRGTGVRFHPGILFEIIPEPRSEVANSRKLHKSRYSTATLRAAVGQTEVRPTSRPRSTPQGSRTSRCSSQYSKPNRTFRASDPRPGP